MKATKEMYSREFEVGYIYNQCQSDEESLSVEIYALKYDRGHNVTEFGVSLSGYGVVSIDRADDFIDLIDEARNMAKKLNARLQKNSEKR